MSPEERLAAARALARDLRGTLGRLGGALMDLECGHAPQLPPGEAEGHRAAWAALALARTALSDLEAVLSGSTDAAARARLRSARRAAQPGGEVDTP